MATSLHHSRAALFLCCAGFVLLLGIATPARAEGFRITANANPTRLIFGTDNNVTLTVNVRDDQNRPAPDGTAVYFNTTLGTLPPVAYTKQGQVNVLLENTTGPGLAIINMTVENSRQTITIEYLGKGGVSVAKKQRISYRLSGRHIEYNVDQKFFSLLDEACVKGPSFTLKAEAIQYSIERGFIAAQRSITLTAGDKTLTADQMVIHLTEGRGFLAATSPAVVFQSFALNDLQAHDDEAAKAMDFHPLEAGQTRTWIICRGATVFPEDQIQFHWPRFFLDRFDHQLLVLPNHVIDLHDSEGGTFFNSKITLTSDAGVNVDFPIYYAASDNHLGSIHLRHVTKGSSFYRGSSGMQVGIEEEYLVGDNGDGDGALYLDDLSRDTRSYYWQHNQEFGKLRLNLDAAYERYNNDTPYTTRYNIAADRSFGELSARLTSNWSRFQGGEDRVTELTLYPPPVKLGKTGFSLSFNPYTGLKNTLSPASGDTPESAKDLNYQGLRVSLGMPTWDLLGGKLSPTTSGEYLHDSDGTNTSFLDAGVTYSHELGRYFATSLSYSYGISDSNKDTNPVEPTQRVSMNLAGHSPEVWDLLFYSSYNLGDNDLFSSANATYYLPWWKTRSGQKRLYAQYNASLSSGTTDTSDQLFSLGWIFGTYSVVLHYSPTGNNAVTGIGSGTGKKWAIELVRQGW